MEAVQESLDSLASLEERITRAIQVVTNLRDENERFQQKLATMQQELDSTRTELDELRGERKQVKSRIEKLLSQLDLLSAS